MPPSPPAAPAPPSAAHRLSLSTKLIFSLPSTAGAAIAIPIFVHMPKFYSDTVLVPLGWLAIGIALARSLDAITDPLMGWISDRTKTRWGRRKPWIVLGVPLCAVALVALFTPPENLETGQAALWFAVFFVLYFIFHTIYDLPHYALGAELTPDYHERTSLFGIRAGFILIGIVVATVLPGVLLDAGLPPRRVFFWVSTFFASVLVVSYAVLVMRVPERPDYVQRESNPLVPGIRRAMRNQPFRVLLLTYVAGSIPGAIPGTLMPFFTEYVLQVDDPDAWLTRFLLAYFVSGAAWLPAWIWLARRIGKLRVWLLNFGIGISGGAGLFMMGPGDEYWVLLLLAYTGMQFGAGFFIGPAMQADVIDYDELHTGKRREAQYGAFWAIVTKLVVIPSAAFPLAFLGMMGYVPNQPQSPDVIFAIRAIFSLAPAFFSLIAFFFALRYPISERIHRDIQIGVAKHAAGETTIDPLTSRELPPPDGRTVDEETGWMLDTFTPRELKRLGAEGATPVLRSVVLKSVAWGGASAVLLGGAAQSVLGVGTDLDDVQKFGITSGVVLGGAALAGLLFHLVRLRPARNLLTSPPPKEAVDAHLAALEASAEQV